MAGTVNGTRAGSPVLGRPRGGPAVAPVANGDGTPLALLPDGQLALWPADVLAALAGPVWTAERAREALRRFAAQRRGALPVDADYERLRRASGRRGRDLPPAATLQALFGSVTRAWLAALDRRRWGRVPLLRDAWRDEEDEALMDMAGELPMRAVAAVLHRSERACRDRLRQLGLSAWGATGYLSPREVAAEYGCDTRDVLRLIRAGRLPAVRLHNGRYGIDAGDAERHAALLRDAGRWLSLHAVARLLDCRAGLIRYLVECGRIPAQRDEQGRPVVDRANLDRAASAVARVHLSQGAVPVVMAAWPGPRREGVA